jgi:DNA-binding transcriptional MocR family regulator
MRLNFSYVPPEQIREGIPRLSAAIRKQSGTFPSSTQA